MAWCLIKYRDNFTFLPLSIFSFLSFLKEDKYAYEITVLCVCAPFICLISTEVGTNVMPLMVNAQTCEVGVKLAPCNVGS